MCGRRAQADTRRRHKCGHIHNVYFGAVLACTATSGVNVLAPDPWWQVKDGDTSSNGNLNSSVPATKFFGLDGLGGYAGVAGYGASTNLTTANVSTAGWLASSKNAGQKIFNYSWLANLWYSKRRNV